MRKRLLLRVSVSTLPRIDAAMNVTKPEMRMALCCWALKAKKRQKRHIVVAIMLAKAKDSTLYTMMSHLRRG